MASETDRIRMEKELEERMADLNLLKGAIEQLPLGVTITDRNRKIVFVNSTEAAMHGYDPDDLRGLDANVLGPPELQAPLDLALLRESGGWKRETVNIRKDQTKFPVQLASCAVDGPSGELLGIVTISEDITQRKRVEETLRDKMARLEGAEQLARAGSWSFEPASGELAWSDQMCLIHGLEPGTKLDLDAYKAKISAEDRERVQQSFWSAIDLKNTEWSEQYRYTRPSGETRIMISRCVVWTDPQTNQAHVSGVTQDVTEMKQVEDALKKSEDRYRRLVESSPDAIILEREDGLVYVNPAAEKLLGIPLPQNLTSFTLQDSVRWRTEGPSALTGGLEEEICEVVRPDGSTSEVEIAFTDTAEGKVPALLTIIRDVTEQRKFMRRARRIQQLSALGEMSATLAHEIRNPLGSIALNFECLCDEVKLHDPQLVSLTEDIREAIRRIGDIVKTFLDFARPAPPEFKRENIHSLLETGLKAVMPELKHNNVTVLRQYDEKLPALSLDPNQMVQVFVNLFLNAKDAMARGGTLCISTASSGNSARIEIADSGTGITPENLRRVFQPFFTTKSSGTGLGLSVVQQILNQHNCSIEVSSKEGSGTSFVLLFPLGDEGND